MIGRLRGTVIEIGEEEALIEVGGVGYVVRCGARCLSRLPAIGEEAILHIESQTTEAAGTRLYGFVAREDRQVFVLLQSVQGVGPKAALSVIDVLPPAELALAIARDDKAAVGRANGVGPKLALRIVTELKGKAIGQGLVQTIVAGASAAGIAPPPPSVSGEAVAALMGLGLAEPAARRAVEQAVGQLGPDAALPVVIKAALKEMGR
jgi:Holliday junction DNA helicase RuvA